MPIPGSPEMKRIEPAPALTSPSAAERDRQFRLAADERRVDLLAAGRGRAFDRPGLHRLGLALERQRLPVAPRELALGEPPRLGAGEHAARLGRRLQARGDVDRVAGGAVFDPAAGADRADDDRAGVDADAHGEALDGEAPLDVAGELANVLGDPQRRS